MHRASTKKYSKPFQYILIQYVVIASSAALRAFAMGAVTMYLYGYCGSVVLLTYGANIFRDTGSDFDPNISTIIMGSVQLLGTMSAIILIDKFGRKVVYMMSTAGAMIGLACVGTYTYLANNEYSLDGLSWVPVVTISVALYATCIGIVPVSIVIMAELLPAKVCKYIVCIYVRYIVSTGSR